MTWGRDPENAHYCLRFTTAGARVGAGVPLILDKAYRVLRPASAYLRYLVIKRKRSVLSGRAYGFDLVKWLNYLSCHQIDWDKPTDELAEKFRDGELSVGLDARTINRNLDLVWRFYAWCEREGYCRHVIQIFEYLGDGLAMDACSLSSSIKVSRKRGNYEVFPFRLPEVKRPMRPIPSANDVELLRDVLAERPLVVAERDFLIERCLEEVGMRAAEVAFLRIDDLPSHQELQKTIDLGHDVIRVLLKHGTKRRKQRYVAMPVLLVERIWRYILEERGVLLGGKGGLRRARVEPKEVFISHKSGKALLAKTISDDVIGDAFRRAGVKVTGHRLRALYLTRLADEIVQDAVAKGITDLGVLSLAVSQAAGWSDISTAKYYVASTLDRAIERDHMSSDDPLVSLRRLKRSLANEIDQLTREVQSLEKQREVLMSIVREQKCAKGPNSKGAPVGRRPKR